MNPVVGALILAVAASACNKEHGSVAGAPLSPFNPTQASFVGDRFVFESTRDGASGVYLAEGANVRRLAAGKRPTLSSDGLRVAFECGLGTICIVNADGSGQRMLTNGFDPDWSPDASTIVYVADEQAPGGESGLFRVGANGGTPAKIVSSNSLRSLSGWEVWIYMPAWSPQGDSIVFVAGNYDDPSQLYLVNPDGSGLRETGLRERAHLSERDPFWSPDGSEFGATTYYGIDAFNLTTLMWRPVALGLHMYPTWSSRGDLVYSKQTGPGPTVYGGWEMRLFIEESGQERQLVPDAEASVKYSDWGADFGH